MVFLKHCIPRLQIDECTPTACTTRRIFLAGARGYVETNIIPTMIQMKGALAPVTNALYSFVTSNACHRPWCYLFAPGLLAAGTLAIGMMIAGVWSHAGNMDYCVHGGVGDDSSRGSSGDDLRAVMDRTSASIGGATSIDEKRAVAHGANCRTM